MTQDVGIVDATIHPICESDCCMRETNDFVFPDQFMSLDSSSPNMPDTQNSLLMPNSKKAYQNPITNAIDIHMQEGDIKEFSFALKSKPTMEVN